jgi:hypothetical protein
MTGATVRRGHRRERPRVAPEAIDLQPRRHRPAIGVRRILIEDADDAVRARDRQRPQDHRVDDAEDRRVDADAEREGEHHRRAEARRPAGNPQGEPEILQETYPCNIASMRTRSFRRNVARCGS